MLLYHGTSFARWEQIKDTGILPRKLSGVSNWEHTIESEANTIYLTDAYAPYFSFQTIADGEPNFAVIIEIDSDRLTQSKFVADEDALEQVSRQVKNGDGLPKDMSMEDRTLHYRKMAPTYAQHGYGYEWSLKALGTCGYRGKIPLKAITRVAIVDLSVNKQMSVFLDPSISIINYQFVGSKYRALLKMVFGDEPNPEDMQMLEMTGILRGFDSLNREGITIESVGSKKKLKPRMSEASPA